MVLSRCAIAIVVRPAHQRRERPLDLRLDLAVHRARRLVEDEHRRVGGDRAREREQLPLADAHRRAALAEHLVVAAPAAARSRDRRPRARAAAHHRRVVERRVDSRMFDAHVAREEEDVLLHVADQPPRSSSSGRSRTSTPFDE